jgi:hypothetical protein
VSKYVPSISESFNAKSTTTKELTNTFISNSYFESLSCPNNTMLIGPRGSGKTTLMRMLEVESLELWDKSISAHFRERIDFSGVFIPTDRFWKTQYEKLLITVGSSKTNLSILESLFIYHVLECFVSVVSFRASRTIEKKNDYRTKILTKEDESSLVYDLADLLKVKPRIPSLRNLLISIGQKKQLISSYISSLTSGDKSIEKPEIVDGELINLLSSSVNIVNSYFDERGQKWAFLFDELELAPDSLVQPLVDVMRGGPENIIFKLALSPYHKGVSITNSPDSSMKAEDANFINLTGAANAEGYKFAKELCENIFSRSGLTNSIESYFEEPIRIDMFQEFIELKPKDMSFANYLIERNINTDELATYGEDKLSLMRKVQFIARLRNFQFNERGTLKPRRRAADFYAGFKNICKATEYNPRMLIGIMSMFIPIIKAHSMVSIPKQLVCISSYFDSFKALLSTIAVDSTHSDFNTIYDVIEKIALFFKREINGSSFKPEPKGSLVFKKNSNDGFIEAIGYALNAGALIADKQGVGSFQDIVDIKNSKCRLSYIFAHHFQLLMTSQKDIDLVDLLNPSNNVNKRIRVVEPSLFENKQLNLI